MMGLRFETHRLTAPKFTLQGQGKMKRLRLNPRGGGEGGDGGESSQGTGASHKIVQFLPQRYSNGQTQAAGRGRFCAHCLSILTAAWRNKECAGCTAEARAGKRRIHLVKFQLESVWRQAGLTNAVDLFDQRDFRLP